MSTETKTYALFQDGAITHLYSAHEAWMDLFDVRDVSAVEGVAEGWIATASGEISAPAAVPVTVAELLGYLEQRMDVALAQVWTFDVAPAGHAAHTVTTRLDARGESRMHSVDRWAQENIENADASLPYWNADGSVTALTAAEATALASQALAIGVKAFDVATRAAVAIQSVSPTIASREDVDAALASLAA